MALPLTENLRQQLRLPELTPTLVMKLDGINTIFGNVQIKRYIRIGDPDLIIGGGWLIGGFSLVDDQSPYIQFSQGTTTRITQKLDPSRGQGSSVSSMTVNLVDFVEQITELVSPGFQVRDILNRRATIFLGAQESSWPEDYNVVFRGVVADVSSGAGFVELKLNNTDEKKRIAVLPPRVSKTTAVVNYKSVQFQDLFLQNQPDLVNSVTVTYISGGTAGSEVVSLTGPYDIQVQIQDGVSNAGQIKKALTNDPDANQLIEVRVEGDNDAAQTVGTVTLGIDNTVDLVDASSLLLPVDIMRTFVQIGGELLEYTGITGNQLTGVTRGAGLDGVIEIHKEDADARQVILLSDNGLNIALKLMLSKGPTYYATGLDIQSIVYYSPSVSQANTVFIENVDLETDHGVAVGDLCTIEGATNAGNDVVDSVVLEVGKTNQGSYVVLSDTLILEGTSPGVMKFKSQYNTLPIGMAMVPVEVDVAQHHFVRDTFLPTFPQAIPCKDITDGKGFLDQQVYLPMTCFSVPRKGRSSVVYTTGPLPTYEVVTLNLETVENPDKLRVARSINENFSNSVRVDYDYDVVNDQFTKSVEVDATGSTVDIEKKQFAIQARGLVTAGDAEVLADRAARRWNRRYQSGAEYIKGIKILFSVGYQVEIGDVVAVDYAALKLSDFTRGNRQGGLKLMEVLNKTLDNKTGEVTVDVVNTIFGTGDRFGLISPASMTDAGSTTTKLRLRKSYGTKPFQPESLKWADYIGQHVIVHPEDYSQGPYQTTIQGFDSSSPQGMSVDPPLPVAPGDEWIIQAVDYPSTPSQQDDGFWKVRHAFFSPQVAVVAGVSNTRFTVDPGDVSKFFIGSVVRVHDYGYTLDSVERVVTEKDGDDIIVNGDLGFTPDSTCFVDLIGFPDEQQAYRVV